MRERILITCFKPFGFTRMIFGINPSEITGKVLFRYARKKDLDVYLLILQVNNNCGSIFMKDMYKLKPNRMHKIKLKVLLLAIFVLGISACAQKTCPTYTKDVIKEKAAEQEMV